jgi:hypothetical protein
VYASDVYGTVLHYDGETTWRVTTGAVIKGGTINQLNETFWIAENDMYAAGQKGAIFHHDGNAWTEMQSGTQQHLFGIWGSSGSPIFAVGQEGTILTLEP